MVVQQGKAERLEYYYITEVWERYDESKAKVMTKWQKGEREIDGEYIKAYEGYFQKQFIYYILG